MKATIAILSVFSAILLFGWVIPDVPYIRRIKADEADKLFDEYKKLYIENWYSRWVKNIKQNLNAGQIARMDYLQKQLILGGYMPEININISTGEINASLHYPEYVDNGGVNRPVKQK